MRKRKTASVLVVLLLLPAVALSVLPLLASAVGRVAETAAEATKTDLRGVYSVNGRLHISFFGTPDGAPITTGPGDMKPSWVRTGGKIVFFRLITPAPRIPDWKTAICVVNTDGTGFRKLTDGSQTDFNPTWSRDGKNAILFSRRDPNRETYAVYMTTAEANPGDEVAVSDPQCSSFANSSLKDGRIFVAGTSPTGGRGYFLLTPSKEGKPVYEKVNFAYPLEGTLDRVSIAPSETKVTCEFQKGFGPYSYPGRTLYIADFDVRTRTVSNPVAITDAQPDPKVTTLYPRWTKDESAVVYHCDKSGKSQLYMYRLEDKSTILVSTNKDASYAFPCGEQTPK